MPPAYERFVSLDSSVSALLRLVLQIELDGKALFGWWLSSCSPHHQFGMSSNARLGTQLLTTCFPARLRFGVLIALAGCSGGEDRCGRSSILISLGDSGLLNRNP